MKLYFSPRTRATRARWLLEELEIPYELVRLDLSKRENQTPEYRAVSPLGEVPALVDGDVTLLEPAAIALYLADRFPEKQLAPEPGSAARGPYYQWLLFTESTLVPAVMNLHAQSLLPEEAKAGPLAPDTVAPERARLEALLDVVSSAVQGSDVLAAGHFSAADLSMASILHLANQLELLERRPRLVEYVELHCGRPACRRAVS